MRKLKELQYKCAEVFLYWNNVVWICTARLPNGVGCQHESHDPVECVAEALDTIEAHIARGTQPLLHTAADGSVYRAKVAKHTRTQ